MKFRVEYVLNEVLWSVTRPAASRSEAVAAVPAEAVVLSVLRVV